MRTFSKAAAAIFTASLALAGCARTVDGQALPAHDIAGTIQNTQTPTASHRVQYTVFAASDTPVTIIYLSNEPPGMTASKKPPLGDLKLEVLTVGPGKPWTFHNDLYDPASWAYVHVGITGEKRANLHCEVAVDGVVTSANDRENSVSCPDKDRDW